MLCRKYLQSFIETNFPVQNMACTADTSRRKLGNLNLPKGLINYFPAFVSVGGLLPGVEWNKLRAATTAQLPPTPASTLGVASAPNKPLAPRPVSART